MMPPYMDDGRNTAERLIANMDYACVNGVVVTQEYIDGVLSRLTFSGSIYISVVCLMPMLLISKFNVPFYFGGTSLLILVGVAMDFMNRVESYVISGQYQSLMSKARKGGLS